MGESHSIVLTAYHHASRHDVILWFIASGASIADETVIHEGSGRIHAGALMIYLSLLIKTFLFVALALFLQIGLFPTPILKTPISIN